MKESFISENRLKYLNLDGEGQYCIGSKQSCNFYSNPGTLKLMWDEIPKENQYKNIFYLRVLPSVSDIKKNDFPQFIKFLEKLKFLHIQFPLLFKLYEHPFPKNLKTLMVTYEYKFEDIVKKIAKNTSNIIMDIKGIIFTGEYDSSGLGTLLSIPHCRFPHLEFLSSYVDKKGDLMEIVKDLGTIEHLELFYVNNLDIFKNIPSNVKALAINNSGPKFPINEIKKIKNLELVQLIGVDAEINCEAFAELNNIREIIIRNSKKIKNAKALLDCKKLESVEFVNCGGALKKDKEKFVEQGYTRLNIEYS